MYEISSDLAMQRWGAGCRWRPPATRFLDPMFPPGLQSMLRPPLLSALHCALAREERKRVQCLSRCLAQCNGPPQLHSHTARQARKHACVDASDASCCLYACQPSLRRHAS